MSTILLELPGDVLDATRLSAEELKVELAISLFERGKLSLGKAAEVAGFGTVRFLHKLGERGIPVHYGIAEYEADLETLRQLGHP